MDTDTKVAPAIEKEIEIIEGILLISSLINKFDAKGLH